jgi:hypothetical protein
MNDVRVKRNSAFDETKLILLKDISEFPTYLVFSDEFGQWKLRMNNEYRKEFISIVRWWTSIKVMEKKL